MVLGDRGRNAKLVKKSMISEPSSDSSSNADGEFCHQDVDRMDNLF